MSRGPQMAKYDMALKIARQVGVDQLVAQQIVQATLDGIIEVLATEDRLELRDFGVFEVRVKEARKARNPRTGTQVMVPEHRRIRFKMGKVMGKRVANSTAPASKKTAAPVATGSDSQP
ncbi:MAG: HU family DNA-binding protein [Planctomycetota bacterium]|nr:HU family DNA-binding protein [Planctomycetota bacterium]